MKITKRQLRRLIKEELRRVIEGEAGDGDLDDKEARQLVGLVDDAVEDALGDEASGSVMSQALRDTRSRVVADVMKTIDAHQRFFNQSTQTIIRATGTDFMNAMQTLEQSTQTAEIKAAAELVAKAIGNGHLGRGINGGVTSNNLRDLAGRIKRFVTKDWRTETNWKKDEDYRTLGDVVDYLGDKTVDIDVLELSQQLPPLPTRGAERVATANLEYPIIVVKNKGQYRFVLDGNHRLQKAIDSHKSTSSIEKIESIKAKILDLSDDETPEVLKKMFGGAG